MGTFVINLITVIARTHKDIIATSNNNFELECQIVVQSVA